MNLERGYIYHIYNQGNNRQAIFFKEENYLLFLRKIKTHIVPFADILAWCLMPNHFHLMVLINSGRDNSECDLKSRSEYKYKDLNQSIGIMLASYTRAINKQENRTGSLFRDKTKAESVNRPNGITPSFITKNGVTQITVSNPEKDYPQVCFNYIHQNPVEAGLVKHETDWVFLSAKDYAGIRNGKLINKEIAKKYVNW